MNDLSFIFPILIKISIIYVIFEKRFKIILKNKRSPRARENLELRLQGKHGSRALRLRLRLRAPGPCPELQTFVSCSPLAAVAGEGGDKNIKMVFFKNESKIRAFYLSGKMGSACIDAKNGQCAFLVSEKAGRVHF